MTCTNKMFVKSSCYEWVSLFLAKLEFKHYLMCSPCSLFNVQSLFKKNKQKAKQKALICLKIKVKYIHFHGNSHYILI